MGDYTIKAQLDARCTASDLMQWLDDADGIAGWWSDTVVGEAGSVGGTFHVTFPSTPIVFDLEVMELTDDAVQWYVAQNPPWWQGTTIRFELAPGEAGGTSLLFTHGGFDAEDPIIAAITPAWVRFVDNLVAVAESGVASPSVVN